MPNMCVLTLASSFPTCLSHTSTSTSNTCTGCPVFPSLSVYLVVGWSPDFWSILIPGVVAGTVTSHLTEHNWDTLLSQLLVHGCCAWWYTMLDWRTPLGYSWIQCQSSSSGGTTSHHAAKCWCPNRQYISSVWTDFEVRADYQLYVYSHPPFSLIHQERGQNSDHQTTINIKTYGHHGGCNK